MFLTNFKSNLNIYFRNYSLANLVVHFSACDCRSQVINGSLREVSTECLESGQSGELSDNIAGEIKVFFSVIQRLSVCGPAEMTEKQIE